MDKKYTSALQSFPPFAATSAQLLPALDTCHARLTAQVTAPVLFTYVWYVLLEAERMGLKRLYFLARDGYVMLQIAQEIAKVHPIGLELRYLYCSRAALRMPSYHRISEEEAMDLLLHRGTCLTMEHILDRGGLTQAQRFILYDKLGLDAEKEREPLSEPAFASLCAALRRSTEFKQMVMENSRAAYAEAIPYFVQEGLTDKTPFGIVDTGWTGSMQRSLRQLSEEIPSMTGFYFGMFAHPKATADGIYQTWYFSADSSISIRTKFNNNLFECMCAAPHGMTIGYRKGNDQRYVPVFSPSGISAALAKTIDRQITICQQFAQHCAPLIDYHNFSPQKMHRLSRRLLQGLMYRPTAQEAQAMGCFTFCDDVTEAYADTLVKKQRENVLREHMPVRRMLRKMEGQKPSEELYWVYGTLAVSSLHMKNLRRPMLRCWDVMRCTVDRLKH
jgi:hypothetical protein